MCLPLGGCWLSWPAGEYLKHEVMLRRRATLVMKKAITCYKPAFWAWIASMKDGKPQVWGCQSGNICTLLLLSMPWGKRTDYTCFVTLCRLTAVNHVVTWAGFPYWLCVPIEPDAALASWICMQVFVLGSHQLSLGNRHGNSDYFQSEQSICVCINQLAIKCAVVLEYQWYFPKVNWLYLAFQCLKKVLQHFAN